MSRFLPAVVCAILTASAATAAEPGRLNLLILTADDMNADSPGWMGGPAGITPALDALAAGSHRFVNNHVTVPICQPGREALMTGRVPHRSGGLGFNPIRPGTPTLVTVLKAAGYYAAAVNKTAHMKPDAEFAWDDALEGSGKNPPQLREQFETVLGKAAAAKKPFFINANVTDPHRPFPGGAAKAGKEPTPRKADKLEAAGKNLPRVFQPGDVTVPAFLEDIPPVRTEVAQYYTGVARFDASLKGVLAALKAAGRDADTVVVFLSDHGMSFPFSKATVYRNGTRSPVVLKYPGMPPAAAHDEYVSSVDIMPTILELLGVPAPAGMDGRSWGPLLRGESQTGRDFVITHVNTVSSGMSLPQRCVRTKDWALMFHAWTDGTAKFRVEAMSGITFAALADAGKADARIEARVKQLRVGEPLMLFDQRADPAERVNLIRDPARAAEVERLAGLLMAHMEKTDDPQTANFKKALAARGTP